MVNAMGRPLKYRHLLEQLEDEELYIPARIADLVSLQEQGPEKSEKDWAEQRTKIRHTMARYAKSRNFPPEGDGKIKWRGHQIAAWLGKRWKAGLLAKKTREG